MYWYFKQGSKARAFVESAAVGAAYHSQSLDASLWAHRSVSLHSIVSRPFYFFEHILSFLHVSFFCTLCFWSLNAHQSSSHCWFNTFFLHSQVLQHCTQCTAPLLALLCSGLLVSWSGLPPALLELPRPCLILYPGRDISSSSLILVFITIVYPFIQKSDQTAWCQRKNNQGVRSSAKTTRKNLENANKRLENLPT